MEFVNITSNEPDHYELTPKGRHKCEIYLREMEAKRKEILDAKKDTADETRLPSIEEMFDDLLEFPIDSDGEIFDSFGVTDNYNADTVLSLKLGTDFIAATYRKESNHE